MKTKKNIIDLQEWIIVKKDNAVKILLGKNKEIHSSSVVVVRKPYKPHSLL